MMWRILYGLGLLVAMQACRLDRDTPVNQDKDPFRTYQDTRLFFQNVRQLYYDREERPEAKMILYRIKERTTTQEYPLINLTIIDHWIQDEAYIYTECNRFFDEMTPIEVSWESPEGQTGTYTMELMNKEGMLAFSQAIFEGIRLRNSFFILYETDSIPFLEKPRDREAFRKTMSDFYRLTRMF
jgi:hypothetical protein